MEEELISVIIPIYKENNNYLKECIESVCKQSYKNLEIILVNDGMTEENYNLCSQYKENDTRIKIIGETNEGVSSARNKGIDEAKGKWITFVDSDDYIDLNFCEKMLKIGRKENSSCVICGYKRVYNNKEEIIQKEKSFCFDGNEFLKKILNVQEGMGFSPMKLWKAQLIKKNKIYFDKELKSAEDALFCMKMSKFTEKNYFLNEPLYYYRFNTQSAVRKFNYDYANKYLCAMQKAEEYIMQENSEEKLLYNYIAYHVLLIVVNYCYHPENEEKGIQSLKKICEIPEFKMSIQKSTYSGFSITRKITLFTLKYKLYILTGLIAKIRQRQFKK